MTFDAARSLDGSVPLVSVLIVNFRSAAYLGDCLTAVLASTIAQSLEVVVVDNDPGTFDAVSFAERFPGVRFLPQTTNTTFTGGCNIAFAASRGRVILLLNPDTRVQRDALERGVAHLETRDDISAVAALLVDDSGRPQAYYRRLPTIWDVPIVLMPGLLGATPRGRRYLMKSLADELQAPGAPTGLRQVEQPPGAFVMLRRPPGPIVLDAGYFNYVSDVDLCARLGSTGEVVIDPSIICWHARGGAGVGNATTRERLRLHHDLTWGVRRYFRGPRSRRAAAWLQGSILVFWVARLVQAAIRSPASFPLAVRTAVAALSGRPPDYSR